MFISFKVDFFIAYRDRVITIFCLIRYIINYCYIHVCAMNNLVETQIFQNNYICLVILLFVHKFSQLITSGLVALNTGSLWG